MQAIDIKSALAERIRSGETVALYCYGILAEHLLFWLDRFEGVHPAVIIDNDPRKRGTAAFDVPVMPYAEAKERYENLRFFICSDDFKYTVIGDLLEHGEQPESIINYVPVEKRRGCLYFYNCLLMVQGVENGGRQFIVHCNTDSFKKGIVRTAFPACNGEYTDTMERLNAAFLTFENRRNEICEQCALKREQYLPARTWKHHYKQVAFYQESCGDCLSHCVYCSEGGCSDHNVEMRLNSVESFMCFAKSVFELDRISEDASFSVDISERNQAQRIAAVVRTIEEVGLKPIVYKFNSCCLTYSDAMAKLLRQGEAYMIWSLDAGTRETYRRIKQIDAFDHVLEVIRRYIAEDAYGGRFIVPKYLIVKGINDNDAEFDAFLALIKSMGLHFVSLSFDFFAEANEADEAFIRRCYQKLCENGLELTYKNNSRQVSQALAMNNILSQ